MHVIPQFPYFGGSTVVGGHASCLFTLALEQHDRGHDVCIISYTEGQLGERRVADGPTSVSLFSRAKPGTVLFGLRFCFAAALEVWKRRRKIDVVHVHSGYADYLLVSMLCKLIGLPTVHTMYCPIPANNGRWSIPGIHALILLWGKRIDWLGGISGNVAASMREYGVPAAEHIRPAIDIGKFKLDPIGALEVRRRLGVGAEELIVLFVGNAKPQKNAISAVRALNVLRREFPGLKLVITTELKRSSNDVDMLTLSKEIADLELEDRVVQVGIVDDMPCLMMASDVLIAPFLDTLGPSDYFMAALEAMACGKPVVVSRVGGMPEVVSNEVGRLVPPLDVEALAESLACYLEDSDYRRESGQRARAYVAANFSKTRIADAYDGVYRRVM